VNRITWFKPKMAGRPGYCLIIRGEHAKTFTDFEAAMDAYADRACADCWQWRDGCCYIGCCTVQAVRLNRPARPSSQQGAA
jgi:hypothetical protein